MSLNSQYPIIAIAMNQVSDIAFAIACSEAGVCPSLGVFNYYKPGGLDYHKLVDELIQFKAARGNIDLIFSVFHKHIDDKILFKLLKAAGVKIIEVVIAQDNYNITDPTKFLTDVQNLRDDGFTLSLRSNAYSKKFDHPAKNGSLYPFFDMLLFKGNKGAGAITEQSLEEMFFVAKNDFPDKQFIAAGGIYTKDKVDFYMNCGALAVAIGTLFAASAESPLSTQTKELMIEASFEKVKHTTYTGKNALVFKPVDTGDKNYTASLRLGMRHPEIGGHIYCGEGTDVIKSVLPLKEIVNRLVM